MELGRRHGVVHQIHRQGDRQRHGASQDELTGRLRPPCLDRPLHGRSCASWNRSGASTLSSTAPPAPKAQAPLRASHGFPPAALRASTAASAPACGADTRAWRRPLLALSPRRRQARNEAIQVTGTGSWRTAVAPRRSIRSPSSACAARIAASSRTGSQVDGRTRSRALVASSSAGWASARAIGAGRVVPLDHPRPDRVLCRSLNDGWNRLPCSRLAAYSRASTSAASTPSSRP